MFVFLCGFVFLGNNDIKKKFEVQRKDQIAQQVNRTIFYAFITKYSDSPSVLNKKKFRLCIF